MSVREMIDLRGKVAVVVGGARDLGLDMAEALAEVGCDLIVTSRTKDAEDAAEKLSAAHGCDVMADGLDVCDHPQVAALALRAVSGRVGWTS